MGGQRKLYFERLSRTDKRGDDDCGGKPIPKERGNGEGGGIGKVAL